MKQFSADERTCRTPASVVCKTCNREFFARSLLIHQKTCFQKNAFVDIACAKCSAVIRSGRFHTHEQTCTGVKPQVSGDTHVRGTLHTAAEAKEVTQDEELNEPDADGRVRCRKCDRAFNEDRIAKHQSVCRDRPRVAATLKEKYDPAKEAKRGGAASSTNLRRRRSQMDVAAKPKPRADNQISKVLSVSFQHQHQQQHQKSKPQVCMSRSYDFGSHFSSEDVTENVRERDKKRFDIVLRDPLQRQQSGMGSTANQSTRFNSSGLSAKSLSLLTSNATSSANPLATNRFMTSTTTSSR